MNITIKYNIKKILLIAIAYILILVLTYSGLMKLLDYYEFQSEVATSPILKPLPAQFLFLIPVLELSIAFALAISKIRIAGFYAILILLTVFTSYLFALKNMDVYLPCACGGILEQLPLMAHIGLNFLLIILACWGVFLQRKTQKKAVTKINRYN